MRKTALATILLAAGMALAQTSATPSTVQGCLSGASGNYTFTDQSGKSWTLTGSTDNLKDHVGNTVQITGNEDTTSNSISVSDVKDISQGCNQTATSSTSSTSSQIEPGTAAGTSTASAGTSTASGTQPDYAPQGTQSTANPQTPAQDQSTGNPQEPNTGTIQATTPSSSSTTEASPSSSNTAGTGSSVQGCLQGSMGSFTITDQSGKSWTLNGDSNELQKHVGNTIQVTGTQDTTNNSISVSNVTDVSQGCQQGAAGMTNQQTTTSSTTTAVAGTAAGTQTATNPSPSDTAQMTQPGPNPNEAPGTNSEPQVDATNNPPTFGNNQQNANTNTTSTTASTSTTLANTTSNNTTAEQQPAQSPATPESSATASTATSTEQKPAMEPNPSMTAQMEQPNANTTATTTPAEQNEAAATEQNESAATQQNETAATEQNEQANQPATAGENANQNATATAGQGTENQQAAAKRGQLPQTASPLPLLLLLGFASLAGAFYAFRRVKA